jgi:hypothetical protein
VKNGYGTEQEAWALNGLEEPLEEKGLDDWLLFRARAGILSIATALVPVLGPTYPPIELLSRVFSQGKSGHGLELTTDTHLVPRLRIGEAITLLSRISSWRGVYLKQRDNLSLPYHRQFLVFCICVLNEVTYAFSCLSNYLHC